MNRKFKSSIHPVTVSRDIARLPTRNKPVSQFAILSSTVVVKATNIKMHSSHIKEHILIVFHAG